jgi:hypothetical protein
LSPNLDEEIGDNFLQLQDTSRVKDDFEEFKIAVD